MEILKEMIGCKVKVIIHYDSDERKIINLVFYTILLDVNDSHIFFKDRDGFIRMFRISDILEIQKLGENDER
jgi:hypothetical protein